MGFSTRCSRRSSAQCTLPGKPTKPTKPTKGPRAVVDWVANLFKRDMAEFVGWHGTNSNTAALWQQAGYLANPRTSGWPWGGSGGTSGADHELGDGACRE
ncbi:hypothetical protein EXIGLDRAFT_356361 [Exidia glandulosa HHB12029]|uniref:Uncharacterized protein n=1 Tax=Exidia glandulosa HHB12029 TaxID=1314781 RepID=A0A165ZEZ2_EXIGL|nr:hypothetical protein EXIGLDRAFT_356361 [Exidia glandulosa HHB12029]